ncbi:hypothetical protein SAMN02745121_03046 [Nannocystis exedens]|uniref:Uncharacterized protein n=1 Tax=Nannocystis exedens TaxID=54 RepID=A0A1I1XUD1_9BACT|nr:hypothetical protein [Nannocystis exedens]PCC73227.1 hypothetical protein NAEX_06315 [Nannocystis exedens]SFE10268.1 hypothetical protein SAMN02745121_03046 [Nannocystis exedens]
MSLDHRTEPEVDIATEDVLPPPLGAPADFRERLVLALRTTEPRVLEAAEAGYRGVYASQHDYVVERLSEHLNPAFAWVLACATPQSLQAGYEAGVVVVWSIPLGEGTCMVFETRLQPWA